MKNVFKNYGIIFLLSFTVMTLIAVRIFYKPDWSKYQQALVTPTPIPTVIPTETPVPTIEETLISTESATATDSAKSKHSKENYPLESLLPFEGKYVEIIKYVAPKTVLVKMKTDEKILAGKEVWDLFQKYKIDPTSHNFEWQQ